MSKLNPDPRPTHPLANPDPRPTPPLAWGANPDPRPTHPLVWAAAIICAVLAVAVIIIGMTTFIGYMIIRPRIPFTTVTYAHLDALNYDQIGQLDTQMTLVIKAENDNPKAHATFSDLRLFLYFERLQIAELTAGAFEVLKNQSLELTYVVPTLSIPLEERAREEVDASLKKGVIAFDLRGSVRTKWRAGIVGSVKFSSHMSCQLRFLTGNGTSLSSHCSSKSD